MTRAVLRMLAYCLTMAALAGWLWACYLLAPGR